MVCFKKDLRNDDSNIKLLDCPKSILTDHEKQFAFLYKDLLENAICKFYNIDMDYILDAFIPFKEVFFIKIINSKNDLR